MKLLPELTIEQTQKLVMTPELIQAIQICSLILMLDSFVQEQLLANPIFEKEEKIETTKAIGKKIFLRNHQQR